MRLPLIWFLCVLCLSCTSQKDKNRLGSEKSPYLQQHAKNPVWWYPWGEAAFRKAKEKKRPIFLSIGYSACHWCHVMEKESFEDPTVAKALNDFFVSVKVDREERPDVDALYMEAVQAIAGRGGWPMTVLITPEGEPFFGGTYFPKHTLLALLKQVRELWENQPADAKKVGRRLAALLKKEDSFSADPKAQALSEEAIRSFYKQIVSEFDPLYGGRKGKPKFPPSYEIRMLLRIHRRTGDTQALQIATKTADAMASGGLFDHLGGGFHRYSTDEKWLVPHFEKMLYDQAALSNLYLELFQLTGEKKYERVVRAVLDYVIRDMSHPEGGFYSSEDADSDGKEGKFYVWQQKEIRSLLTAEEWKALNEFYDISEKGNFENQSNILSLRKGYFETAKKPPLQAALKKLKSVRDKRARPFRDEKVITAWNGLMIAAMARAAQVFGEARYVDAATRALRFLLKNNQGKDGLFRRWIGGQPRFDAYVDDYAFLIEGLIELYQADFNPIWLATATALQKKLDEKYWDEAKGGYFFSAGLDPYLLRRGKKFIDNVRPSGNSVAALNLFRLGTFYYDTRYESRGKRILNLAQPNFKRYATGFAQMFFALDFLLDRTKEVAIVGDWKKEETQKAVHSFMRKFNPNKVVSVGMPDSGLPLLLRKTLRDKKTTFYVCENRVCKFPTTDIKKANKLIDVYKAYSL